MFHFGIVMSDRRETVLSERERNDFVRASSLLYGAEYDLSLAMFTQPPAHLIWIPEAARITGLSPSLLRKSFMCEEKRPKNIPPPPPHKRIGRAVYIVAGELPGWIESLGMPFKEIGAEEKKRRGRPTVSERIMSRCASAR
jgi:hypothetical protein